MPLDYSSLLTAFTISGTGLAIAFFFNWLVTKSEKFLINWAITITLLTTGVWGYEIYTIFPSPLIGSTAYMILVFGLSLVWGVSREFRCGALPRRLVVIIASAGSAVVALPMLMGLDGISYILLNLIALGLLLMTARDYWLSRAEAPLSIATLSSLYVLIALSFIPCAILLLRDQKWHMGHAPFNWAEELNVGISLAGLAGIGAISLMLNQVRVVRTHKIDAETDDLTGLFNRRALFARENTVLKSSAALIIFDIDCFKQINDVHGHLMGDEVLRAFGETLKECSRAGDLSVRLGGEEFALVLPHASSSIAVAVAERIRAAFAQRRFTSDSDVFFSTVSGGVSCLEGGGDLDTLLRTADEALYDAKRSGRNRVVIGGESGRSTKLGLAVAGAKR